MTTIAMKPRLTSFAPQFLVDDLERSIAYSSSANHGTASTPSAD
jgi:hypothetical protein